MVENTSVATVLMLADHCFLYAFWSTEALSLTWMLKLTYNPIIHFNLSKGFGSGCFFRKKQKHFHVRKPWYRVLNSFRAFVWAHRKTAGGLTQSSYITIKSWDGLCVMERESKKGRGRQKHRVSSHFTAPIIAMTLAGAEACLWVTALATYNEANSFIKIIVMESVWLRYWFS